MGLLEKLEIVTYVYVASLAILFGLVITLYGNLRDLKQKLGENYDLICDTMESFHKEEVKLVRSLIEAETDALDEAVERRLCSIEDFSLTARSSALSSEKLADKALEMALDVKSTIEGMKNSTHKVEYIPMDVAKALEESKGESIAGEMLSKLDEAIQRGSNINADFGEI